MHCFVIDEEKATISSQAETVKTESSVRIKLQNGTYISSQWFFLLRIEWFFYPLRRPWQHNMLMICAATNCLDRAVGPVGTGCGATPHEQSRKSVYHKISEYCIIKYNKIRIPIYCMPQLCQIGSMIVKVYHPEDMIWILTVSYHPLQICICSLGIVPPPSGEETVI